MELLVGFRELFSIPTKFPIDIVLFSHCDEELEGEQLWFAAALEADSGSVSHQKRLANNSLVLYQYQVGVVGLILYYFYLIVHFTVVSVLPALLGIYDQRPKIW